jgi:hypothetical protein
MEFLGVAIWAAVIWWGFRAWRRVRDRTTVDQGSPARQPDPSTSGAARAGGPAGTAPPGPQRPADGWVGGAVVGGYLVHRHHQDGSAGQDEPHDDGRQRAGHEGWATHEHWATDGADEMDELDSLDEYGEYDEYGFGLF